MAKAENLMVEQLKNNFKAFEARLNGISKNQWHQMRKEAIDAFTSNGFPGVKDEEYRYTPIGKAIEKNFDLSMLGIETPETGTFVPVFSKEHAIHIFIRNGKIDHENLNDISEAGVEVCSLKDALVQYPKEIESHLGKYANVHKDSFAALNMAFSNDGVFIKIPRNTQLEKPLIVHYITEGKGEEKIFQTRNLIIAEEGSNAKIIESYTNSDNIRQFSNHVTEIVVKANANFNFYKLQNQGNQAYHIDSTYISQLRDSTLQSYVLTLEGKIIRNNLNIILDGENCEAHMFGLYVIHEDSHIDNHTSVDHKAPNCYSNEVYKGILDNNSKGVFNGKVFVRQDAQKTNAYQSNKNILLTDTATINTKPQLEIWADDVSCSHGCTTGQLDEEQLFYLRSRGIGKSSARAMLLHAFVNDVLDKIEIDFLHDYFNSEMYNRLDWES